MSSVSPQNYLTCTRCSNVSFNMCLGACINTHVYRKAYRFSMCIGACINTHWKAYRF